MVAQRPDLTALKTKPPTVTDTPQRRALERFRPSCRGVSDDMIQQLWDSLSPQARQQYRRSLEAEEARARRAAKKKAKKKSGQAAG